MAQEVEEPATPCVAPKAHPQGAAATEQSLWLGAALVGCSAAIFGFTAALVRKIEEPMPQLMEVRYLVGNVTAAACLVGFRLGGGRAACGRELLLLGPQHLRLLLACRTMLHWLLLWAWWVAVRNMPLGDATAIGLSGPVLTALLAWWVLGEPLPPHFPLAAACATAGVLLVANHGTPTSAHEEGNRAVGLAAVGLALTAGALLPLFIRVSTEAHWMEVEHVTAFGCSFVITPLFIAGCALWDPDSLRGWSGEWEQLSLSLLLGLLAFIGLGFQTRGFQLAPATRVAMMWYTQIPICYGLQWALFSERPSLSASFGALLVVAAALLALAGTDPAPASDDDGEVDVDSPSWCAQTNRESLGSFSSTRLTCGDGPGVNPSYLSCART